MEKIVILANRLAESILFDWDKEEVFKLAKEVAVACHENIEFVSLVKRMREAQNYWWNDTDIFVTEEEVDGLRLRMEQLESEVDEYLEKMEEEK